jgi:hypothetical protein
MLVQTPETEAFAKFTCKDGYGRCFAPTLLGYVLAQVEQIGRD